jgi:F-type H+-transporting ATPase subunit b
MLMKTALVLLAAEGHKPAPLVDIDGTVFVQFGLFLLLLIVLNKFVFRPYLALMKERDANIDGARTEAQQMNARAGTDLESYEDQVMNARKEAAVVRGQFREEGEKAAGDLLAEARNQSDAKITAAREKIQRSADAARLALRTRADGIAKEIATRLLGREV